MQKQNTVKTVAVVGNYLPRHCGIATFTTDLTDAIVAESPDTNVIVVAMDDIQEGYPYPSRVQFQIRDRVQADYVRAAEFLNARNVDAAIIEHEYGIFGGKHGSHLFHLLENMRIPFITTLHTVLSNPAPEQKAIIQKLGSLSEKLIVMAEKAYGILTDVYKIDKEKIALIPHGIHDVPFVDPSFYKDSHNVEGRKVILTFGLLSPGKGIEYMIDAMPEVVKKHPEAVYLVLGTTHPHLIRESGEEYRHFLMKKVKDNGNSENVIFYNQFFSLPELTEFLTLSDIYVTPYLSKEQITSGTLSYALGMGKAVISTPYWHAEELLADERGILVPFKDSEAIAKAIIHLLDDENKRNMMRKQAYQFCRPMVWKEVARDYLGILKADIHKKQNAVFKDGLDDSCITLEQLPEIKMDHFLRLTDDTGILQHSIFSIPDRNHGYCTDDNARALIVSAMYTKLRNDNSLDDHIDRFFSFLYYSYNPSNNHFRNFMSYNREWLEEKGSDDSNGRVLWALGYTLETFQDSRYKNIIVRLFQTATRNVLDFTSPRSWAFTLIGIHSYLKVFTGDANIRKIRKELGEKLMHQFKKINDPDWLWPEKEATYSNAHLPHALLLTGNDTGNQEMVQMSLKVLEWLLSKQTTADGHLSLIGNNGWMNKSSRAVFDQQPVEAMALVYVCKNAYIITKDRKWRKSMIMCFEWFTGKNDINLPLYDFKTGGCFDGLQPRKVNLNMGGESTISWLLSLLIMYEIFSEEKLLNEPDLFEENK